MRGPWPTIFLAQTFGPTVMTVMTFRGRRQGLIIGREEREVRVGVRQDLLDRLGLVREPSKSMKWQRVVIVVTGLFRMMKSPVESEETDSNKSINALPEALALSECRRTLPRSCTGPSQWES